MLSSALLVLLQVCSHLMVALAMPTCQLDGHVVQSAHNMLQDLGERFPAHCLPYNVNISFPGSALPAATANQPQCRRALWVAYESLQEAELIFEDELPSGLSWDEQKVNKFKHLMGRVIEDGSCLSSVDGSAVLSSYFSNVTAVLEQQDSAACGWMALRRDLLWVLKSTLYEHHACFSWSTRTPPTKG